MIEVIDVLYGQTGEIAWGCELFQDGTGYLTVSSELIAYWKRWLDENSHTLSRRYQLAGKPGSSRRCLP